MKWWITKTSRRLIRWCKAVDWSIKIGMVFKGICRLSSNQNMSCHLCAQVLEDNQKALALLGCTQRAKKSFKCAELNIRPVHSSISAWIGSWSVSCCVFWTRTELDHKTRIPRRVFQSDMSCHHATELARQQCAKTDNQGQISLVCRVWIEHILGWKERKSLSCIKILWCADAFSLHRFHKTS